MLRIENTVLPSPEQWEMVIEGMRNPKNSWHLSDSYECDYDCCDCGKYWDCQKNGEKPYIIGENDHKLMMSLAKGGAVHAKYRRMIPVFLTIDAPLYWWKEFDTYKVGTVANSCSTMHKIHAKPFTMDDFSCDHLEDIFLHGLRDTVCLLNNARNMYLIAKEDTEPLVPAKDYWWQMIQLLPTSYNQKRTVMLNYEVLVNIYHSRKNHKLDEWHVFCDWIEQLPYSEIITGGDLCV
jgi:hypothetical protein